MGIKHEEKWTCDLCGSTKINGKNTKGWVTFDVDDQFVDRTWHSKVVCANCIDEINRVRKKT